MELSDELLEQIGVYLSGQMPAGQKDQFEARLQEDPTLRQEVALQQEMKQGLSFLAQKDRFRQMHTDLTARGLLTEANKQRIPAVRPEPPVTKTNVVRSPEKRSVFRYGPASWAMAASLVLLLGIGWVLYQNQADKQLGLAQNERVFNTFFSTDLKPVPNLPADPDRVAASPEDNQSEPDSVRLRSAVETLQRGEFESAIQKLSAISTERPGHWNAVAQWYLALAYVKTNQGPKARQLARQVAALKGHPYQQEARQLLRQLTSTESNPR